MNLREELGGIIDKFSSDEGVVTLEKNGEGGDIRIKFVNGEYRVEYYLIMFFAKRRFNHLRDKYEKREGL